MSYRCDAMAHCDDDSDEEECTFVMQPRHEVVKYHQRHIQRKTNGTCGTNTNTNTYTNTNTNTNTNNFILDK